MSKGRTLIESARYKSERDALRVDVERMDEMLRGVVGVICASPGIGIETPNAGVRMIFAADHECPEDLVIFYTTPDDDHVVLESIIRGGA